MPQYKTSRGASNTKVIEEIKNKYHCPDCETGIDVRIWFRDDNTKFLDFAWACKAVSCEKGAWEWNESPALKAQEDDHEI